jgi:hypothetical protein
MAVHHETCGSEAGFSVANAWSRRGSKYCGEKELRAKWRSFDGHKGALVSAGTIVRLLEKGGRDWLEICDAAEPGFERFDDVSSADVEPTKTGNPNPLRAYSLRGQSAALRRQVVEEVYVMQDLALRGQGTVIYAPPNTGKTLINLRLVIDSIVAGRIDPETLFYANLDDNLSGLVQKLEIAEKYGFHMIADGYQGFSGTSFLSILWKVINREQAHGSILVCDTAKQVANLMDKSLTAEFGGVIRKFVLQGGTAILLAHTNKVLGPDGWPVYGGVADLVQDTDASYLMRAIDEPGAIERKVEFRKIKTRGDNAQTGMFGYRIGRGLAYEDLLSSVRRIDDDEISQLSTDLVQRNDEQVIAAVREAITGGHKTRMGIERQVRGRTGVTRAKVLEVLDRCAVDGPGQAWTVARVAHGAMEYHLLTRDPGACEDEFD